MADTILSGGGPNDSYESATLGYQPSTRTVRDVITIVRRQFGDEAGVQIEDDDVIRWVNMAQDTIVNRNRVLKARATTYSIVGDTEYSLPGFNIEQVESLWYAGRPIPSVTMAQVEQQLLQGDEGEPRFWYEWGGVFRLFPSPKTPQKIELYYTTRADVVTNVSDPLSVPDKYFESIVAYCLQMAYEMDEDLQVAQEKAKQFQDSVNVLGEEERTEQHMTYQTITLVDSEWY